MEKMLQRPQKEEPVFGEDMGFLRFSCSSILCGEATFHPEAYRSVDQLLTGRAAICGLGSPPLIASVPGSKAEPRQERRGGSWSRPMFLSR